MAEGAREGEALQKAGNVIPVFGKTHFNCPRCGAHAQQSWLQLSGRSVSLLDSPLVPDDIVVGSAISFPTTRAINWVHLNGFHLSRCFACGKYSSWVGKKLSWPLDVVGEIAPPAKDMPVDVRAIYSEAMAVFEKSPRAAAALLRLAIELLCRNLGKSGDINGMIGDLVADGLPVRIQRALDVVRVIGNEAVHPGQIELNEDPAIAASLFHLVNLIVERLITEARLIDDLFESLPPGKLAGIESRDRK